MTCVHLKQLYQLCQGKGIKLSSSDLIHIVCEQCGEQEVCPSMLMDQYDAKRSEHGRQTDSPASDEAGAAERS